MRQGDLTTIANVRAWLGMGEGSAFQASVASDPLLTRLITAASEMVLQHLNRSHLEVRTVTETHNGPPGAPQIVLKQFPVTRIVSVRFYDALITASVRGGPGYVLSDRDTAAGAQQTLSFLGPRPPAAPGAVTVEYEAGYSLEETRTVPDPVGEAQTVTVTPYATFLRDLGVTYDGAALSRVTTGTPGAGQYKVSSEGVYTFPAAMAGDEVTIAYSHVPSVIEDCVIQLIGQKFKAKDNIGVSSKTLGGQETIVFDKRDMTQNIRDALTPYRRVA